MLGSGARQWDNICVLSTLLRDAVLSAAATMAAPAQELELCVLQARFQAEVLQLCDTVAALVRARHTTIAMVRAGAEYLDTVWLRCRVSRTAGTGVSVLGGGLTIAGGILTIATAGAGAPILIAGLSTSSVGSATNIGTSVIEKILNSRQIKEMNEALDRDKDITLKIESQIDDIRRYKDSAHLSVLLVAIQELLGPNHLLIALLQVRN